MEEKKGSVYEKLQLLRCVTNSTAVDKASIILDASKHIDHLKQRVQRLNQEMTPPISLTFNNTSSPPSEEEVGVELVDKGFLINVYSNKPRPGLLVAILETFEELGVDVLDARVSCTANFQLHALVGQNRGEGIGMYSEVVKQAVLKAMKD